MNKYLSLLITVFFIAGFSGCGDNKTKGKLIGTSIVTSSSDGNTAQASTPQGSSAAMMANAASMAAMAGMGGSAARSPAPALNAALTAAKTSAEDLAGLTGPDANGFFTYPGITGSTMKIQFLKADGVTWINCKLNYGADMQYLKYVHVVLSSAYDFGTFGGDFTMIFDYLNQDEETVQSGVITLSNDPAGLGGFTATISGMVLEMKELNGVKAGFPKQGSMTIASVNGGYSGTNTYTKSGDTYKCDGSILASGVKVAEVHLTYDTAFANYTGYWLDTLTNDGVQHAIVADVSVQ